MGTTRAPFLNGGGKLAAGVGWGGWETVVARDFVLGGGGSGGTRVMEGPAVAVGQLD